MKHGAITITNSTHVKVELSEDRTVWMTKYQIASLFDIRQALVESNIALLFKANPLWKDTYIKEVDEIINGQRSIVEYFNMEIIVALSFRIDSYVCSIFRQWCVKQIIASQTKSPELFIQLGASTMLN